MIRSFKTLLFLSSMGQKYIKYKISLWYPFEKDNFTIYKTNTSTHFFPSPEMCFLYVNVDKMFIQGFFLQFTLPVAVPKNFVLNSSVFP